MESLKDKYKDYFLIGTAVDHMNIETEKELLIEQFNSITCENQMKFGCVFTKENTYKLKRADKIYNFAKENGMSIRGHNLVWHNQTPYHIFNETPNKVEEIFRNHIRTMNEHYGDVIKNWDVVNEAIEDKSECYLRKSVWKEKFGEEYIKKVFTIAREELPESTGLFYNDYNEYIPEKRNKIVRLIKELNSENKLVDGIGMQCHVNLYYPTIDLMRETLEIYAELGLRIHITEMDLSFYSFDDKSKMHYPEKELEEKHAKLYGEYFSLFREFKDYIDNVTLWGVTDNYTWLDNFPVIGRKNWPLLFGVDGRPKEAFYRVMDF